MTKPIWTPSEEQISSANMTTFIKNIATDYDTFFEDYQTFYDWSVKHPEKFWEQIWEQLGVVAESKGSVVLKDSDKMPGASWFPGARLNFAENLLREASVVSSGTLQSGITACPGARCYGC